MMALCRGCFVSKVNVNTRMEKHTEETWPCMPIMCVCYMGLNTAISAGNYARSTDPARQHLISQDKLVYLIVRLIVLPAV